ncbi:MAG: nuclear transport factor 2 family protein [Acidimicrobiia bacterium]|nr:nuclear transport factor 2 family protein [Acidimicrobiia bacterium]
MHTEIIRSLLARCRAHGLSRRALFRGLAGAAAATAAAGTAAAQSAGGGTGARKPTPDEYTALRQVAERYVDAVNRFDGEAWGGTFAPDGEWHLGSRVHKGRDQAVGAWSGIMKGIPNIFMHVYSGVIDEVAGDTASGRWYMGEYLNLANGTQTVNHICYSDTYVRIGGQWYIQVRKHGSMYSGKADLSGRWTKLSLP